MACDRWVERVVVGHFGGERWTGWIRIAQEGDCELADSTARMLIDIPLKNSRFYTAKERRRQAREECIPGGVKSIRKQVR